jgi:4-hydroxy-tetrahydrodipicolinate synthase
MRCAEWEAGLPEDVRFGISPALATPVDRAYRVDAERLAAHATDLLARGCSSVTVFGTTGEGPSFALAERDRVAQALVERGIAPETLVEGVIASSIEEAAEGAGRALRRGAKAVLLAPPFYFRGAADDDVFAWYSAVFARLGRSLRDIILYHIPAMTGAPLSIELIGRLRAAFPRAVIGVKDSAGDPQATMRLIEAHGDLIILVGDESYLGRACAAGAAGSICGLANIVPEAIVALVNERRDDPRVQALVDALAPYGFIPMLKALVAHRRRDPAWATACPPLPAVAESDVRRIVPLVEPLRAAAAVTA